MSLADNLNWRYATKKFDNTKKVDPDTLQTILDAVQLSPSSYGLQPYRVFVVENAEIREKLKAASYGQPQLTDASQVIIFAAETHLNEAFVKHYMDNVAATRNIPREALAGFEGVVAGAVTSRTPEQLIIWAQKQAYIALGVLISAASAQHVDICPMEGFDAQAYNEILGLTDKGLAATVIATIGYRSADDETAKAAKVRRPASELFIHS